MSSQSIIISAIRRTPPHVKKTTIPRVIKTLTIIVPCYNEASTIAVILDKILAVKLDHTTQKEIIVVNDYSEDDTDLMVKEYLAENSDANIKYIRHSENKGKGASIHSALKSATGEYVLIQDADLEYDPAEYNLLMAPIQNGYADIVYGSRFMGGNPHRILFFWHTLGNKLLTLANNLFTNLNLTDAHTCYKVLKTEMLRQIPLKERRFAFDAELNVRVSQMPGIRIYEVGISYYGRTFKEGKKIRFRDAMRSIFCLIRCSITRPATVKLSLEPTEMTQYQS